MPLLVEAANFSGVCTELRNLNPYKESALRKLILKHQVLLKGMVHTTGEVVLLVFCKLLAVHNFYSEQNLCISDPCFFPFYRHISTSTRWKQEGQILLLIPRVYDCGATACDELGADNRTIISPMFVPSCTRRRPVNYCSFVQGKFLPVKKRQFLGFRSPVNRRGPIF